MKRPPLSPPSAPARVSGGPDSSEYNHACRYSNPGTAGAPITFTATITLTGTDVIPPGSESHISGTVTFFDGATPLAIVPVTNANAQGTASQGTAVLTISSLQFGNHALSAHYSGEYPSLFPNLPGAGNGSRSEVFFQFFLGNVGR